jgi:hypothetical protein
LEKQQYWEFMNTICSKTNSPEIDEASPWSCYIEDQVDGSHDGQEEIMYL